MRRSSTFCLFHPICKLMSLAMVLTALAAGGADVFAAKGGSEIPPPSSTAGAEYVILFVLEGIGQESLKGGTMPVLSKLVSEGSATWSATSPKPALRLPLMASLITGLPVERHGITWNTFEFSRGYPRAPTVFDYLDLSGGRDSAIFFMDESLYQLAKPEPYTDYQMCGPLRPECNPAKLVSYIRDYFKKATSGHGHGHAILSLPHLLVIHLPAAGRAGETQGWKSAAYRESLKAVDKAMGAVLDLYRELDLLKRTTVFVTSLSTFGEPGISTPEGQNDQSGEAPRVPWIASGAGIKKGHAISQPVSLIDTGATVMRALGLETHTEWDSHAVEEIFKTASSNHSSSKHP
ncbi:MAG TPA: alkaline phosphatase family protein [Nitrospiraceae bacterium]|nr:alkaline phosphatase family protein [Nitrospiraceae bacterium]